MNENDTKIWYVYALSDPRECDVVRYVGCSQHINARLSVHVNHGSKRVSEWCKSLATARLHPSVRILDQFPDRASALAREKERITEFKGPMLLNTVLPCSPYKPETDGLELATVERMHINYVLELCGGNKLTAAKALGIGRQTLYNKLAEYEKSKLASATVTA